MWVTGSKKDQGMKVLKRWGFKYVNEVFIWVKITRESLEGGGRNLVMGKGSWSRCNTESVLLGVKGQAHSNLRSDDLCVNQVFFAPKSAHHSEKPAEAYALMKRLVKDNAKCVDLFAREQRDGWSAWGNQVRAKVEK